AAVCDVYDAVTSVRPYNNGWNPGEALRRMFSWKGHFDEAVLRAFISCLGIYPVGSLVRMQSARIGVIVDQGEKPLEPMVKVFYSAKSNSYITPQLLDLSRTQDRIAGVEDPEKWHFKDLAAIWSNYRN
ncbi:MAG: phosphodiesterase, partial [Rhodocyclaceae bacterium]|nr:phosphodiesterase [Rhodocyclaceae bacterium]